jgi:hypothetical protein
MAEPLPHVSATKGAPYEVTGSRAPKLPKEVPFWVPQPAPVEPA